MSEQRSLLDSLDRFLFAPADALDVAIFRIILAVILAANFRRVGDITPLIEAHPSVRELYQSILLTRPYHALCLILIALFGAGVRSRPIGFVLVVLLTPLNFVSDGQQSRQMLIFALMVFSFLHSDRRLAIGSTAAAGSSATAGPMWPMRLIQLQLSLVYGINAIAKTTQPTCAAMCWWDFRRCFQTSTSTSLTVSFTLGRSRFR